MDNEIYNETSYKDYNIRIEYENYPMSPRDCWDSLGTMICWHNRYTLGDKHDYERPSDFQLDLIEFSVTISDDEYMDCSLYGFSEEQQERVDKYIEKNYIILPLYLYNHSGITMKTSSFSCPWDSGQVGWIYVSYEKLKSEYGWTYITKQRIKKIEEYLRNEVATYDNYLTGTVFGYNVIDPDGESIDSCWGYYGYDSEKYIIEEAKDIIDYHKKEEKMQ